MFAGNKIGLVIGAIGMSVTGAMAQQSWQPFGNFTEGSVRDLHVHNGELYLAGGKRNGLEGTGAFVRRWNGTQWVWVGNQLFVEQPGAYAIDLTSHNGEIYAVGFFNDATFRQAARWDGNAWQPVGDGLGRFGWRVESFDGKLWAIAVQQEGPLVAPQFSLKVLEGSQWIDPPGLPLLEANWLGVVDGEFYVGTTRGELLRYDNGAFVSLGAVASVAVGPVTRFNGRLHVGLTPRFSQTSRPLAYLYNGVWAQSNFFNPGQALSFVSSMQTYNGELYMFGQFISVPIPDTQNERFGPVARWCPGVRGTPTLGNINAVYTSITWQGQLLIGAETFGTNQPAVYRLTDPQNPIVQSQLTDVALNCGAASRSISLTSDSSLAPRYIYRENVDTGLLGGFTAINNPGPQTTNITLPSTLNGEFRFIVTDVSGSSVTNTVRIRGIDIDFNNNGVFPEDQDVIDFLSVLAGGPCTPSIFAACDSIDINVNGIYPEDADVIAFFTNLAGGCE